MVVDTKLLKVIEFAAEIEYKNKIKNMKRQKKDRNYT